MQEYQECEFRLGELVLRGKRWGMPGGKPVLALHGWIDNCASFDLIAPLMPELDLVCIDLAGHGHSSHRCFYGAYNIWQDVGEVFAVADALSWDRFALIGHSRGGWIATLAAGTFPQRISHLAAIEGFFPPLDSPTYAPQRLGNTIKSLQLQMRRPRRYYRNYENAVTGRVRGILRLSRSDAEVLARWGVAQFPEGYAWSYDTKVLSGSELRLTKDQVDAFVRSVTARTQVYIAEKGLIAGDAELRNWLEAYPAVKKLILPGDHHIHMHSNCEAIARSLELFFAQSN